MNEAQIEWLERNFPKGFVITIVMANEKPFLFGHNPLDTKEIDELIQLNKNYVKGH